MNKPSIYKSIGISAALAFSPIVLFLYLVHGKLDVEECLLLISSIPVSTVGFIVPISGELEKPLLILFSPIWFLCILFPVFMNYKYNSKHKVYYLVPVCYSLFSTFWGVVLIGASHA